MFCLGFVIDLVEESIKMEKIYRKITEEISGEDGDLEYWMG